MAAPMKNMDKLVTDDIQKILDKFGTFTVQDAREKVIYTQHFPDFSSIC